MQDVKFLLGNQQTYQQSKKEENLAPDMAQESRPFNNR